MGHAHPDNEASRRGRRCSPALVPVCVELKTGLDDAAGLLLPGCFALVFLRLTLVAARVVKVCS